MQGDGSDTISIRVKEIKDKPGKPIYLTIKDKNYELLLDQRCVGNTDEDNFCKKCRLKFRCFTSEGLKINLEDDLGKLPVGSMQPTLGEMVGMFLAANGVDLTALKARAKMIENEKAQREDR